MTISVLAIFTVCIPAFLWIESRAANPLIPLNLIWHRPRANLLFSNFIAAMLGHSILFNMYVHVEPRLVSFPELIFDSAGLCTFVPSSCRVPHHPG